MPIKPYTLNQLLRPVSLSITAKYKEDETTLGLEIRRTKDAPSLRTIVNHYLMNVGIDFTSWSCEEGYSDGEDVIIATRKGCLILRNTEATMNDFGGSLEEAAEHIKSANKNAQTLIKDFDMATWCGSTDIKEQISWSCSYDATYDKPYWKAKKESDIKDYVKQLDEPIVDADGFFYCEARDGTELWKLKHQKTNRVYIQGTIVEAYGKNRQPVPLAVGGAWNIRKTNLITKTLYENAVEQMLCE